MKCITCGDEAVKGKVVGACGCEAVIAVGAHVELVATDLVDPVEIGDVLLCHAGIAIRKVAP
jgi:hydrogenase maturation factor